MEFRFALKSVCMETVAAFRFAHMLAFIYSVCNVYYIYIDKCAHMPETHLVCSALLPRYNDFKKSL